MEENNKEVDNSEVVEKKEPGKKRGLWSIVVLIVVVIALIIIGYIASQCTTCGVDNSNTPLVGELDHNQPFGPFLGLPIEEGVDLEEAILTQYEGSQEIVSISYNSSKNPNQILTDFETFFMGNGWEIINKDDFSIYGTKDIDSINVLSEEKDNKILVTISYTKEIGE